MGIYAVCISFGDGEIVDDDVSMFYPGHRYMMLMFRGEATYYYT